MSAKVDEAMERLRKAKAAVKEIGAEVRRKRDAASEAGGRYDAAQHAENEAWRDLAQILDEETT